MRKNSLSRSPAGLWGFLPAMIGFCHDEAPSFLKKILAPLIRKVVITFHPLPMDVRVGGMALRCRFVDNYSEKKFVFTPWRYDQEERRIIRDELPDDGVFVDIGANVGLYTITAAMALGPKGTVLSFEPNPGTMERLHVNVGESFAGNNAAPDIRLLGLGVADRDSEFELRIDQSNLGASSIATRHRSRSASSQAKTVVVQCRPLLNILSEQGVNKIDILKIDIEGAEDIALAPYIQASPEELLARTIIIENSPALWGCDLFSMIEARGYKLRFRGKMNSVYSYSPSS